MSDLETRLEALGDALAVPSAPDLLDKVRDALGRASGTEAATPPRSRRPTRLIALTVAAVLIVGGVVLPASRHAITELFQRGPGTPVREKQLHRRAAPAPAVSSVPSSPPVSSRGNPPDPLIAAQPRVDFTVRVPRLVPARVPSIAIDESVPGGLISLDYGDFRIVEVAAGSAQPAIAQGVEPRTRVTPITVGADPGVWITGTHHRVAYFDRDGILRTDTVRDAGHVLVWSNTGVTIRIEGFHRLEDARQVADTIH